MSLLRKLFNLQTIDERFEEYKLLEDTLELQKAEFNSIVDEYFKYKKSCESQIQTLNDRIIKAKGTDKEDFSFIKERINQKYNNYLSEYLDKCILYKNSFDQLEKSIEDIIKKDNKLIDKNKTNFVESILILTKAQEEGQISPEVYKQAQLKIFELATKKDYDIISLIKSYTIGTIRDWKGGKFQKVNEGEWKKVEVDYQDKINEFESQIQNLENQIKKTNDYDTSLKLAIKQKNAVLDLLKYEKSIGKIKINVIGMQEVDDRYNTIINKK
jgi:hypothetical protein